MIDVSQYQTFIDWAQVNAHGVRRVIVKLGQWYRTEGYNYDPYALANLKGAREHGLQTGVYWFATPTNAPHREADAFLRMYHMHAQGSDIVPTLDLETTGGHDWPYLNDWKAQWFHAVDHHFGVRAMFYSYYYYWRQMHLYPDRPVWGAAYGTTFQPPESWVIWQHSGTGTVPGIHGHVDLDRPLRDHLPTIQGSQL